MPKSVDIIVREVGLRDGLQLVKSFVPTETKLKWLRAVAAAGVPEVEVTNFVPAKVIPQFADAADVARGALEIAGPRMCALAPNRKGAENMLAAGIRKINFVLSVSEGHNLANVRKTPDQSFAEFESVVALRKEKPEYKDVTIQGCLATSFGCTIEGRVDPDRVRFWEVMGTLRWGVMCCGMMQRFRIGPEHSIERAMIGRRSSETEIDLLRLLAPRGT